MLDIAEPISPDDRAAMDDHASAKGTTFPDYNIGIEHAIIPDR